MTTCLGSHKSQLILELRAFMIGYICAISNADDSGSFEPRYKCWSMAGSKMPFFPRTHFPPKNEECIQKTRDGGQSECHNKLEEDEQPISTLCAIFTRRSSIVQIWSCLPLYCKVKFRCWLFRPQICARSLGPRDLINQPRWHSVRLVPLNT